MSGERLRHHDLVAKVARVTIKDTIRVMKSLRLVAEHLDCSVEDILTMPHEASRASPEEAGACQSEFHALCLSLNRSGRGAELKMLRAID